MALHQTDRTIGLPIKVALGAALLIGELAFRNRGPSDTRFFVCWSLFAGATAALTVAYQRWRYHERELVLFSVMTECFAVVLMARVLEAPLEVLAALPIVRVVLLVEDLWFHARAAAVSAALVFAGTAIVDASRFAAAPFWWGIANAAAMVGSSMAVAQLTRRRTCPACAVPRLHGSFVRELMQAQEEERKRIAREIHDTRSQNATALIIHLDVLHGAVPESEPALREGIERVRQIATMSLDDAQRLIYELRPALLDDLGLDAAIRWYVRHSVEAAGITAHIATHGIADRHFEIDVETTAFRVVQEALANTVKHAGARHVWVNVQRRAGSLTGSVADDGSGFSVNDALSRSDGRVSFGLVGMHERIHLIGGRITIKSSRRRGTRVSFRIPIDGEGEGACDDCSSTG